MPRADRDRCCPARCRTGPGPARLRLANAVLQRSAQRSDSSSEASRLVARRRKRRAFVEHHLDVGAEQALHLDRALRRQRDGRAVDMRLEGDAVARRCLRSFASDMTWKPPESVRIGPSQSMNRCRPPSLRDALGAGPQHQMIGVAEDDVGAGRAHVLGQHRLHRGAGADRHEGRRAHDRRAAWR